MRGGGGSEVTVQQPPLGAACDSVVHGGRCGGSGGLLGRLQQIERQQVEHGEQQNQADQDLLYPHARIDLLLQPRVGGHQSHELREIKE